MTYKTVSNKKTLLVFCCTIVTGFILFALPNVFFGITKINDGLTGVNLLFIALFQLTAVCSALYFSLRLLNKDFQYIGWSWNHWQKDSLMGIAVGLAWTALQFGWIIPATGGAERADIMRMLNMMGGTTIGLLSYLALGIIGGGITEEIFNRGYFINVLKDTFKNPKVGLRISAVLSIIFFAVGHLPSSTIMWMDILIPTIAYTLLFIYTKRLAASIFAHSVYNTSAILLTYIMY